MDAFLVGMICGIPVAVAIGLLAGRLAHGEWLWETIRHD
jgi:hypothetical protein